MIKDKDNDTILFIENAVLIDEMYKLYLKDPNLIDISWQKFFVSFQDNTKDFVKTSSHIIKQPELAYKEIRESVNGCMIEKNDNVCNFKSIDYIMQNGHIPNTVIPINHVHNVITNIDDTTKVINNKYIASQNYSNVINNDKINLLILNYRKFGHLLTKLDPLNLEKNKHSKDNLNLLLNSFDLQNYENDLIDNPLGNNNKHQTNFSETYSNISNLTLNNYKSKITIKELVSYLDKVYCESIGIECDHLTNYEQYIWITNNFESIRLNFSFTSKEQHHILTTLFKAELFEQFLHTKFPGAKRFSIEGGESCIVALNQIIDYVKDFGIRNITIGMAHRGRLNVLANVIGKPYKAILSEFLGNPSISSELGINGDVKYHMGYSSSKKFSDQQEIYLSLIPNPSHLEAVNAVVMGQVKAKQNLDKTINKSLAILIHGDAAFCGQGVVAESLTMSGLYPYDVGGIIHIVVNNQIGFTANPSDGHDGRYATNFAKIIEAPIIHINGDDIEAIIQATYLAVEYRNKFHKDIVLDIVCYRKYGHNEGDEPTYTQVLMYKIIQQKISTANLYANKLVANNILTTEEIQSIKENFKNLLNQELEQSKNFQVAPQSFTDKWSGFSNNKDLLKKDFSTGVAKYILQELGMKLCTIPKDFALHSKLKTLFDNRKVTLATDQPIDFATAEQLAYATILKDMIPIRLTGQDSIRGTFSHRHAIVYDQNTEAPYSMLNNIAEQQAEFFVADSNLSEYAVLGFEYGYSLVNPKKLVIWEAQFGDFANGAQIVIDQFISSAETKWLRQSGLVMLLPHGFEGQGPEHSSARLERFLQLCAENNIQVTYPTTPSSLFHLLRRQLNPYYRIPLIVMSPKSLLRHKLAVSNLDNLSENTKFISVLDEDFTDTNKITKIIFCTGKIYYDLFEARQNNNINNITIIRLEQLYPLEQKLISSIITKYHKAKEFIWCQEEPLNMGAWSFIKEYLNNLLLQHKIHSQVKYVGRKACASPATGYLYVHNKEQQSILKEALNIK